MVTTQGLMKTKPNVSATSRFADLFASLGRKTMPVGIRNMSPDDGEPTSCKVNERIVGRPKILQDLKASRPTRIHHHSVNNSGTSGFFKSTACARQLSLPVLIPGPALIASIDWTIQRKSMKSLRIAWKRIERTVTRGQRKM